MKRSEIKKYFSSIGKRGGKSKSPAKRAAGKINIARAQAVRLAAIHLRDIPIESAASTA